MPAIAACQLNSSRIPFAIDRLVNRLPLQRPLPVPTLGILAGLTRTAALVGMIHRLRRVWCGWRISDAGRARLAELTAGRGQPQPQAAPAPPPEPEARQSPGAVIESAHREIREALSEELLQTVISNSAAFFEQLVVDLLVAMGYGGSRKDAGEAVGGVGDDGIDGIIKEDRLGLGLIYVQAKKWARDKTVGRPEIQRFAGALQGHRAQKDVFITTSTFTRDAEEYVSRIEPKIVLIDGHALARLMTDFGVGVTTVASYDIKRVDPDYFADE